MRPGTTAGARVFYALEDRFADPDQEALVKARIGQLSGLTSGVLLSLNLRLIKTGSDFAGYRFDARMPSDGGDRRLRDPALDRVGRGLGRTREQRGP